MFKLLLGFIPSHPLPEVVPVIHIPLEWETLCEREVPVDVFSGPQTEGEMAQFTAKYSAGSTATLLKYNLQHPPVLSYPQRFNNVLHS